MRIPHLAMFIVSLGCTGCAFKSSREEAHYWETAQKFKSMDPIKDSETAFRTGDYRVYTAMGYGRYYPGLNDNVGTKLEARFDSRNVPSTDALHGKAMTDAVHAAVSYAEQYNTHLLTKLRRAKVINF